MAYICSLSFFPLFSTYIYSLCSTQASLEYCVNSVLHDFDNDGVVYLELRTTPREAPGLDKDTYIATILSCIRDHDPCRMRTYLILSIDRRNTFVEAMEVVDLAIKYRSQGVVGVDLCGDPSKGDVSIFRSAFAKAKPNGLKITLHFAEVPASSSIEELESLLSFEPDRLGHVIHVPEPIKQEIVKKRLSVELCISCNVLAELIEGGVAEHHFRYWAATDCPVILGTDDVGVFCSDLSNEYLIVAQAFGLDKSQLLALSSRAIDGIFGGDAEKERLRQAVSACQTLTGV